jgi:hypothetical protein
MDEAKLMKMGMISKSNKEIAKFMGGYVISSEDYELPHGSRGIIKKNTWFRPKNVPLHDFESSQLGRFGYNMSWDWLMPVIREINSLGKGFQFSIFKTYVSCTVEKPSRFHKDFSFSYAEYITPEQSDLEAAYKLVVKFVEWNNEHKLVEEC